MSRKPPVSKFIHRAPGGNVPEPNSEVHRTENDFAPSSVESKGISSLSLTTRFPGRPGHGTQGKPIVVFANYFEVKAQDKLAFYRYSVDVKPEGKAPRPSKAKTKRLVTLLLEDPAFRGFLTDYRSTLVSRTKLSKVPVEIVIPFRAEGAETPPANPSMYRITIQETGTVLVSELVRYLGSSNKNEVPFVQRHEVIQALNTIFGYFPRQRLDLVTIGQSSHFRIDPSVFSNLGGGLHALRGFFKSVRPATSRLLLNVNVSHAVCFAPVRLDQLIKNLNLQQNHFRMSKRLKLLRLQRLHLDVKKDKAGKVSPSVATFWDFATENDGSGETKPPRVPRYAAGPKDVKFFLNEAQLVGKGLSGKGPSGKGPSGKGDKASGSASGNYISVWDYFEKNYAQIRMNPSNPVVNIGNRQYPRYLPVEACQVMPGQPVGAKLSPDQTRAMIEFACRGPKDNADSILRDGLQVFTQDKATKDGLLSNGLKVSDALITVHARVLQPPAIKYSQLKQINPNFGSWNMGGTKFFKGSKISKWAYVYFRGDPSPFTGLNHLKEAVRKFTEAMRKAGIDIANSVHEVPAKVREMVKGPNAEEINSKKVAEALQYFSDVKEDRPEFLLVILPSYGTSIYRQVKIFGDRVAGIQTICVVASKFAKEQRQEQYFANVALKFNLKAGGINHALDPIKLGIISEGRTMVVGIDVTHPSPQSIENAPSVAGIVASVDKYLAQWPADLRVQESRKEMVSSLQEMFETRLALWRKKNGKLPENVIIYRDGVSEGQYQTVLELELPLLRKACTNLYPAKVDPNFSIIIVGKRHHTRFYPSIEQDADNSSNCRNGTVVDRGVTEVRFWHFFLQAHACLQGTARPAHYYVILDEVFQNKFNKHTFKNTNHRNPADALEELTHNMCHLFGRATKAVSICPPAYYADLVCERARCYLSHVFDPVSESGDKEREDKVKDTDVKVAPGVCNSMFYI